HQAYLYRISISAVPICRSESSIGCSCAGVFVCAALRLGTNAGIDMDTTKINQNILVYCPLTKNIATDGPSNDAPMPRAILARTLECAANARFLVVSNDRKVVPRKIRNTTAAGIPISAAISRYALWAMWGFAATCPVLSYF